VNRASPADVAGIAPVHISFFFFTPRLSYLKAGLVSTRFIQPHSFFQLITPQDESRWVNEVVLSGG
jgi:hypothetical protein